MLPLLVIGALLLGVLLLTAAVLFVIATWRLRKPAVVSVEFAAVPPEVLDRQRNLALKLNDDGFTIAGIQQERRGFQDAVWQSVFRFGDGAVWGVVETMPHESPRIVLHTFLADGQTVTTSSGPFAGFPVSSGWHLTEDRWPEFDQQAKTHLERILNQGSGPVALQSAEEFQAKHAERIDREFAQLEADGLVAADASREGEFKWATWKSFLQAPRMLFEAGRYRWLRSSSRKEKRPADPLAAVPEEDLEEHSRGYYQRHRSTETSATKLGLTRRGVVFFAAIVALLLIFAASGKLDAGALMIIAAVLVIHELGHVLAMRCLGCRDDSILFLPLLGRLGGGRRRRLPVWQQFAVLLAGPLPGLLLGWGLLLLAYFLPGSPDLIERLGLWFALLNNLHLLVVLPFDGGRIVNLLIFDRFPAMRLIYLLVSGALLVALLLVAQFVFGWMAWPFLLLLIPTFLSAPDTMRAAHLARMARRKLSPGADESDAVDTAIELVNQSPGGTKLKTRAWADLVDWSVRKGCSKRLGTLGTAAALLVFLGVLHLPVWAVIGLVTGESVHLKAERRLLAQRVSEIQPERNAREVVVSRQTRQNLEALRDVYQDALEEMYSDDLDVESSVADFDERGIYDPSEALGMIRGLRWDEAAVWIGETDSGARQKTARVLLTALMGDAEQQATTGNLSLALSNFGKAYWAVTTCEPRTSLAAWIDWLYLERELLDHLEHLMNAGRLDRQYTDWFAAALRSRRVLDGEKLARLLLYDLEGMTGRFLPGRGPDRATVQVDSDGRSPEELRGFAKLLARKGYPLRHSALDRSRGLQFEGSDRDLDLQQVVSYSRVLRGLPTREEFEAGLEIAEDWAAGDGLEVEIANRLADPGQRKVWRTRIEEIQKLVHFRRLAALALETELSRLPPDRPMMVSTGAAGAPPQIKAHLVGGGERRFMLLSSAPDGTRQRWRMSPNFHPRKPDPPVVPAPVVDPETLPSQPDGGAAPVPEGVAERAAGDEPMPAGGAGRRPE